MQHQASSSTQARSASGAVLSQPFTLGHWRIDPAANEVSKGVRTLRIEPKAMRLLACLAEHAEQPVTRRELCDVVWPDAVVGEDSLSRLVFQLRRVLGDDARQPRFIQTLPKVGYRLAVVVRPDENDRPSMVRTTAARESASTRRSGPSIAKAVPAEGRSRPSAAGHERVPSVMVLIAMAVLGCAFSGGWWTGRVSAQRYRRVGQPRSGCSAL